MHCLTPCVCMILSRRTPSSSKPYARAAVLNVHAPSTLSKHDPQEKFTCKPDQVIPPHNSFSCLGPVIAPPCTHNNCTFFSQTNLTVSLALHILQLPACTHLQLPAQHATHAGLNSCHSRARRGLFRRSPCILRSRTSHQLGPP